MQRKNSICSQYIVPLLILAFVIPVSAQQIDIPRIELMPDFPEPYRMRDWKQVTHGYDSLVFDLQATGTYLPLIWKDAAGINYPGHERFGIHSYVGTKDTDQGEAINVIPAVVGATLVGIDKSDQNGINWVLMCEDFFNRQNGEYVYLNNFSAHSGGDWWYDTMPNIFFYQLYHQYPDQGDFTFQFQSVADRWMDAIVAMGGSTTPWKIPKMGYWAWDLIDMKPVIRDIKQPEAAGALAWIEYMAYRNTAEEQYRITAEWAMDFLNQQTINPGYELQLPYGVYAAARMNAELGTDYDVETLLNWCFTPSGNVRQWGMTLGNWGGYDCYGLIGEALYGGYAFAMNGFEQVGALLPMLRYDDRFTRAIAKWTLHCANASRLFYANYLPDFNQDSENWAHPNDPHSYIAYESLREEEPFSGTSPFATGDAKNGGWAYTNLGLYGSSHVGILGAVIDTTNVPKILKLDLLKTDYFAAEAYPSFVLYNPLPQDTGVVFILPDGVHDVYDAVTNQFLFTAVSGSVHLEIPSDEAVLAVVTPVGGAQIVEDNILYVGGVVVDYNAGQAVANYEPRIRALSPDKEVVSLNETINVYCTAQDRDGDVLNYGWSAEGGSLTGSGAAVQWTAPDEGGEFRISCRVSDIQSASDSASFRITVLDNFPPRINAIEADPAEIMPGETVELHCDAVDDDGDTLIYFWKAPAGSITGQGSTATWQSAAESGFYWITCSVSDAAGATVSDSVGVIVGDLVAWFPFSGNALDSSAFGNHGTVSGAVLSADQEGLENKAYYFDGNNDFIRVPNSSTLNFQNRITVSFWMRVDQFFDREAYPVSHGNWQNRWKISIGNKKLRWTVNTFSSIKDLDSNLELETGRFYFITCMYNGSDYKIYINGQEDNTTTHSGKIRSTTIDLTIGQTLPNEQQYNFKGVLDDIRIYNKGLTSDEILALYQTYTDIEPVEGIHLPERTTLAQNWPNPFNDRTAIGYGLPDYSSVELSLYNVLGQKLLTLVADRQPAGYHTVNWNAADFPSGVYYYRLTVKSQQPAAKGHTPTATVQTRKMVVLK